MVYRFTILVCVLAVMVSGCKKKSKPAEETPTPITQPVSDPAPPALLINVPADADGVFLASMIPHKFPNLTATVLGIASVYLYTSPTNHTYVDGGLIKANDSIIPRLSSGSYYFYGKPIIGQNISGIDFQSGSGWEVAGNSATAVPSFTYSNGGMPYASILTGPPNASRTNPFNAALSASSGADSLVLILSADSVTVKKTVVGGTTMVLYTAGEIAGVRKQVSYTQGSLTIVSYKMSSAVYNNKKYYFINAYTTTCIIYIGA